ncbi:MAG: hypothetical protein ABSH50_05755 [Bryobacteraceae bacterium]|jgi:hypothetical protein
MINTLLRMAFLGCAHRRTTFPLTSSRASDRTYVACLDCGMEFEYDWKAMRRGAQVRAKNVPLTTTPAILQAPDFGQGLQT